MGISTPPRVIGYSGKKRVILLVFLLVVFIPFLIGLIFYLDSRSKPKSKFAGYYVLEKQINDLTESKSNGTQTTGYTKLLQNFKLLENNNLSENERKKIMSNINTGLMDAYIESHDHKFYQLQIALNSFILANSPAGVKAEDLKPLCFDPVCAPPQAPEIASAITQIQNSKLPDYIKGSDVANLTNFSYLSNDNAESKAGDFLGVAGMIRINPEYVKLGLSEKIATEIENYVKKNFPKQYESYISVSDTNLKTK